MTFSSLPLCMKRREEMASDLHQRLNQLSEPILASISTTPAQATVKSTLESLLSSTDDLCSSLTNFCLACALLSSSRLSTYELLSWIPEDVSRLSESSFSELSRVYEQSYLGETNKQRISDLGVEYKDLCVESRLVVGLMPDVFPLLKQSIKQSSIDEDGEFSSSAASARAPVGDAIIAAYQFRWFVTQVGYPHLGRLCSLVIPCSLTALDHWSPEVKGQGMISFTHLVKNVNAAECGLYEDAILEACCLNIACADEIWHHVVEMAVLLGTSIQANNPRSIWFERILNEMLGHLERQPRNKVRRIIWLQYVEPLLNGLGLVLLAHFRRVFPLLLKWMHAEDDETVLLALKSVNAVFRFTWIRNTPYVERVMDELTLSYKESSMRMARKEIRIAVLQILTLLQRCKGKQFETAWDKHRDDLGLTNLVQYFSAGNV